MLAIGDDRIVLRTSEGEEASWPRTMPRMEGETRIWQSGEGVQVIAVEARPGPCETEGEAVYADHVRVRLSGRELDGCGGRLLRRATGMSILSDNWIREQAQANGMIEPFVELQRREGCISYGLSSYGYDARVADEFKIFTNVDSAVVDPKDFAANSASSIARPTSASSRRTASRSPAPSNISAFPATCSSSASASRPMPAAGSSST